MVRLVVRMLSCASLSVTLSGCVSPTFTVTGLGITSIVAIWETRTDRSLLVTPSMVTLITAVPVCEPEAATMPWPLTLATGMLLLFQLTLRR
jgi:hypothetical protein